MEMVAIKIPNESYKNKLIGRDARTIRAFRQITNVELVIDDSSDQVYLKSPDSEKIQIARRVLESMIRDGRFEKECILKYAKTYNI